jgi:6-phospho-3-hexuloisomerase
MSALHETGARILDEVRAVIARMEPDALAPLARAVLGARRIALYSAGRTGLVLRGLAMRLYHLGLDAHFVGEMTVPPLGAGDLLIVNASMGDLPTGLGLLASARNASAATAVITAVPDGAASRLADLTLRVPAQTLHDDQVSAAPSILPMGSQYELALFVLAEALVLDLARALGRDFAAMRARHTNLL